MSCVCVFLHLFNMFRFNLSNLRRQTQLFVMSNCVSLFMFSNGLNIFRFNLNMCMIGILDMLGMLGVLGMLTVLTVLANSSEKLY